MLKVFVIFSFIVLGLLEARVVNDEYRGNSITYSKDSYNKTTTNYWVKKKYKSKRYKRYSKKVLNDEYRANGIRYSSKTKMTRAQWERKHKKSKNTKVKRTYVYKPK